MTAPWTSGDHYDDYGPLCCAGGCCGAGSYCCGHPDNDHIHDPVDDLLEEIYFRWSHDDRTVGQLIDRIKAAFRLSIKEDESCEQICEIERRET